MANKPRKAATPSPTSLGQLPPDLLTRILAWLPLCALGRTAQTSRRFKILCYSDPIYIPKLRALGVTFLDPAADDIGAAQDQKGQLDLSKLAQKLKQLPGGSLLNTNAKYLETGSLFDSDTVAAGGSNNSVSDGPRSVVPNISLDGVPHDVASQSTPSTTTSSASTSGPVMTDVEADAFPCDAPIQVDSTAETAKSPDTQKISATLPQMKKSNIVVGAGGIKSHSPLGKTNSSMSIGTRSKSPSVSRGGGGTAIANTQFFTNINGLRPRDAFKHIITVLAPYYLDFRNHAKDSKVFRDYKDMVAVAQLLNLIVRLSKTGLISDCDDVNLALETTVEWYESMLLGQFERAYDAKHVAEMKRNAVACMELNGGKNCVLLFCAKNPIFFDATFNPSLVASKLPNAITSSAEARGYALADDFARFMDHTLTSCTTQAILVSQVFPPSMDAMTTFVSKVFDDSISEYLVAVLRAARDGEGVAIYLHTLATAVHCCSQFLDLVSAVDVAGARVVVRTRPVKDAMARLFASDWNSYANVEMEHLGRVIDNELRKWNTRKPRAGPNAANGPASFLTDAESSMAHKRQVMTTFKKVLFAPYALGKTVGYALMSVGAAGRANKAQMESLLGSGSPDKDSFVTSGDSPSSTSMLTPKETVTYHLDDGSLGSLVSLELCLNLMHMSKESLGRMLVITNSLDPSLLKVNAGRVFVRLLQGIGEGHMNPAFAIAISRLEKSKPVDDWSEETVNIDSLQFFELVHIADLVHQMLDVFFAEDVRPWIDEKDFLSDVMVEKKAYDRQSDDNVAHGMDKAIQVLITQVDHILDTKQKATDYNPSNDGVYDFKPTQACLEAISCLNAHTKLLNGVTNKDTLEVFFGEVGVRLFNVICKNLKKQQVSQSGALQLVCDMNKYHEWATTLRVASVTRLFNVLKELGSLYMAEGGEELRNLVHDTERYQGALRPEEIYELLASRTDYKKIQKFVEAKECIVM